MAVRAGPSFLRALAALGAVLGLAQATAASDLQFVMPICEQRDSQRRLLDPPYRGSVELGVPAAALVIRPSPAEWPAGGGPPGPGSYVSSMILDDPAQRFFRLYLTNLQANLPGKIDLLTHAHTRRYVTGLDSELPRMGENLVPPFRRRAQPVAGMWVWEMPQRWINPEGQVRADAESTFTRIFQPVAREDEAVIRCEYARYSKGLVGPCTAFTRMVLDPEHRCAAVAVDYGFFSDQMDRWAELDAYVKDWLRQRVLRVTVDGETRPAGAQQR